LIIVTHAIEEAAILGRKILLLGQPPNIKTTVVDNPGVDSPDYRLTPAYYEQCSELRRRLEVQTTQAD
jgi:NitT/TauT family transport system ATP-binding protein